MKINIISHVLYPTFVDSAPNRRFMRPGFDPRSSHCSNYILNSICISPILLHLQPLHDLIIGPDSGHWVLLVSDYSCIFVFKKIIAMYLVIVAKVEFKKVRDTSINATYLFHVNNKVNQSFIVCLFSLECLETMIRNTGMQLTDLHLFLYLHIWNCLNNESIDNLQLSVPSRGSLRL